jgi:hypothetical protein
MKNDIVNVWVDFFDFDYEDQAFFDKDLLYLINGVKIRSFSGVMQSGFSFRIDASFAKIESLQPIECLQTVLRSQLFEQQESESRQITF